jgi:hypothetical protein
MAKRAWVKPALIGAGVAAGTAAAFAVYMTWFWGPQFRRALAQGGHAPPPPT